jgi:hypothetical protein
MGLPWAGASQPQLRINQWPPTGRGKRPDYEEGFRYMLDLSKYSGGLLVDASRTQNLSLAFEKIAAELSSQYSLGYYPKNPQRYGAFHRVKSMSMLQDYLHEQSRVTMRIRIFMLESKRNGPVLPRFKNIS